MDAPPLEPSVAFNVAPVVEIGVGARFVMAPGALAGAVNVNAEPPLYV